MLGAGEAGGSGRRGHRPGVRPRPAVGRSRHAARPGCRRRSRSWPSSSCCCRRGRRGAASATPDLRRDLRPHPARRAAPPPRADRRRGCRDGRRHRRVPRAPLRARRPPRGGHAAALRGAAECLGDLVPRRPGAMRVRAAHRAGRPVADRARPPLRAVRDERRGHRRQRGRRRGLPRRPGVLPGRWRRARGRRRRRAAGRGPPPARRGARGARRRAPVGLAEIARRRRSTAPRRRTRVRPGRAPPERGLPQPTCSTAGSTRGSATRSMPGRWRARSATPRPTATPRPRSARAMSSRADGRGLVARRGVDRGEPRRASRGSSRPRLPDDRVVRVGAGRVRAGRALAREGIDYAERVELWNHRHYMAAHLGHVLWATGSGPRRRGRPARARRRPRRDHDQDHGAPRPRLRRARTRGTGRPPSPCSTRPGASASR